MVSPYMVQTIQFLIDQGRGNFATLENIKYKAQRDIPINELESDYLYSLCG